MTRHYAFLPAFCSVKVYIDVDDSEGLSEMEIKEKLATEGVVPTSVCWQCSEEIEYEGNLDSDSPVIEDLEFDVWTEED